MRRTARPEQVLSIAVTAMYAFDVVVVSVAYTHAGNYVLMFTGLYCASIMEIYSIGRIGRWLSAKRRAT